MSGLIIVQGGEPVTTTLAIAEGTENKHEAVIKLVRKYLPDLEEFGEVGFQIRLNQQGSNTEYALLNEQQSSVLIAYMRNGEKVREFKKTLVKGFFEMRSRLRAGSDPLAALPPEQKALVTVMVDNAIIKAKQAEIEATQAAQQETIRRIEAKQSAFENGHAFFTVIGFCTLRGVVVGMTEAQRIGKRAAAISKDKGIPIDRVRDVRFGMVNAYHESALEEAFSEVHEGM